MNWLPFLHFYQPYFQQEDILDMVVRQSYRPLFKYFADNTDIRISINISGALLESLDKFKHQDILEYVTRMVKNGNVEFTGTSAYHSLLPLIPPIEIKRQVTLNAEMFHFYTGSQYAFKTFFPPEMAYSEDLGLAVCELGYEHMILDEISSAVPLAPNLGYYKDAHSGLGIFLRERGLSNSIMSAVVRKKADFTDIIQKSDYQGRVVVSAMDGETFGHHRPGLETLLFDILKMGSEREIVTQTFCECAETIKTRGIDLPVIKLRPSTWATSLGNIHSGVPYISWKDHSNEIHTWQWEFLNLVYQEFSSIKDKKLPHYDSARKLMDEALASDQYFWASGKPWWSLDVIEVGAYTMLKLAESLPGISQEKLDQAKDYYRKIVSTAFSWQRTGRIRKMATEQNVAARIPFKERTWEKGGSERGVYEAFIAMFKDQEKKAAMEGNYEKAIAMRDAVYKIENKSDLYDAVNVIDLLRMQIPNSEIEKTLDKYTAKYKEIKGGQPEQRG